MTNDNWNGKDSGYPAGMSFEGSFFPRGRDEKVWGPEDPLEVVPPAGPFDAHDGEETWRLTNGGREIWTGEAHVRCAVPTAQQQQAQTRFWQEYHAREAAEEGTTTAAPAAPAAPAAIYIIPDMFTTAQQSAVPAGDRDEAEQVGSDIDGEWETDEDYDPRGPQQQPAHVDDQEQGSTVASASSPQGDEDWDDDSLLSFWKSKLIRKKGYEPMLVDFPGQTVGGLRQVWRAHKGRCEQLGAAWRAAGKPAGPVSEWFRE
ncbi:hypothetical protein C7974DRAFT_452885 [Boeremia exigua]|uniref:uncharacterized protein n=1 Tax=Boeremia exigua TaxID=749465 RepID=UPI001E8EF15D|nr:uncharacterized protein C7974DRAFT_452885 [Boeremia exigua]KAH6633525.1 hypothetical protein C7974DRAFT_452885 [Boeremia exigua]